jgi:protein TonB
VPPAIKESPAIGMSPEHRVASAPKPESSVVTPPAESSASPSALAAPHRGETTAPAEPGGDRLAALRPQSHGGGLRDGRGGIEGEPIPLDTRDPKFSDYFERIRKQIKENWVYPREAAEKNVGGSLMMEFGIAKDGQLRYIELRRSSGIPVLDDYAVNAVKLAQPFPPIPDQLSRTGIPVVAVFNYIIDIGALNNFLR